MSAHAGIVQFDRQPIGRERIASMTRSLEARGPDGGSQYARDADGLAMAYRAFHTCAPADRSRGGGEAWHQPFVDGDESIITFDGRLDNRDDLIDQLPRLATDDGLPPTDVEIVAAAFRRWGADAMPRLIGDWSLAIWHAPTRTLRLARDFAGVRPLFYRHGARDIIWSSEIDTFLADAGHEHELDDEYLGDFLVFYGQQGRTPFKNILAVPPGATLTVRDAAVTIERFWSPDARAAVTYTRDEEYEAHFRALFRRAVRDRLRVHGTPWAELSGGLDSSSIVCMADNILKTDTVEAARLDTVSYVFDETRVSDERTHIKDVERRRGRPGLHLEERQFPLFDLDGVDLCGLPQSFPGRAVRLGRLMRREGARVLLSGQGGDAVMWSQRRPCLELTELAHARQYGAFLRRWPEYADSTRSTLWNLLRSDVLRPLTRPRTAGALWMSRAPAWASASVRDQWARRTGEAMTEIPGWREMRPGQRYSYRSLQSQIDIFAVHYFRSCARIDVTYPFVDRRLVEFMSALPAGQKSRPGQTRSLHRRALAGLLPESIAMRTTKAMADGVFVHALAREWPRLSGLFDRDARVARRGYVDLPALTDVLRRARTGADGDVFSASKVVCLEIWLRHLEQRTRELRRPSWAGPRLAVEEVHHDGHRLVGRPRPDEAGLRPWGKSVQASSIW